MLSENRLKTKLQKGEICLGAMVSFPSSPLVELFARCGSDAVIFEAEHGSLEISHIEELARACEVAGVTSLCRVPAARAEIIARTMDAGVMGIIVPHVKTKEDAEFIVSCVKYPPRGQRGFGTIRASGYGSLGIKEYLVKANDETMVIVMIEDPEAVDNLESILSVEGVDCVFLGRGDLSLGMGYPGQTDAPEVRRAVDKVVAMTLNKRLTLMVAATEKEATYWINRGSRFLSIQTVGFIRAKWMETLKDLRNYKVS
jgi:2-keto-3-deoxy-L-rhamnonate aldolase RhmA